MVYSMTGFGNSSSEGTDVEIRSVNNRYLEVTVRGGAEAALLEARVREAVRQRIARGKVTVTISSDGTDAEGPEVDLERAAGYLEAFRTLKEGLDVAGEPDLALLSGFREIFRTSGAERSEEDAWNAVGPALEGALDAFLKMRGVEGEALGSDLLERFAAIEGRLDRVEDVAPERSAAYAERLRGRIQELAEGIQVEESRIAQELALYADRIDISEECTRLRSHLHQARQLISSDEPAGRPLNFLLQEIHREVNTIGSKANDADISFVVVGMKEELERIREQVQNIE